jgi:hypothetical protein
MRQKSDLLESDLRWTARRTRKAQAAIAIFPPSTFSPLLPRMSVHYHRHGLAFDYPQGWELSEETSGTQRTVTLQTAGASFWTVTIFEDRPDPEQVVASIVQAFRDEYENVDVYPVAASTDPQAVAAADLDFIYLDTVTSVAIRAFQTEDVSTVVMYQGTDQELEQLRPKFDAVIASLKFESDAD